MNTQRLTVKELINELSHFNPDAFIVTDNFDDIVKLHLSWSNENIGGDCNDPRDIAVEMEEATHVSIDFIVNDNCSDNYKNIEK